MNTQPLMMIDDDATVEDARIAALHRYQLLDTAPETAFDRISQLAARIFNVPLAMVNLIDADRQWTKSCSDGSNIGSVPLAASFCTHTIRNTTVHVVPDTLRDSRFVMNPFVTGSFDVRFYAGAPLRTPDGYVIGTLCLIDTAPRELDHEQQAMLADCAVLVMDEIKLRQQLAERTQVEQSLRLYEQALAATSNGVVITDPHQPDNPIVYCNPAFERLSGYARDEVLGHNCRFLQGPETDPAGVQVIRETVKAERECEVVLKNYRKDGTPFWNKLTLSPIRDMHGAVTHFVGVQADVSIEKEAEQSLILHSGTLQEHAQLLERAFDAILVHDLDLDMIRLWNQGAETMYGWTKEDALAASPDNLLHTEYPKPVSAVIAEVQQTGQWEGELIDTRKDGTRIIVSSRWTLQHDIAGAPRAILKINRDITAQKRVEQERVEHLEREQAARIVAEDAQQRLAFLAEAGRALADSLDYNTIIATIARLATTQFADLVAIDVQTETGEMQRMNMLHADPAKQPFTDAIQAYYRDGDRLAKNKVLSAVLQSGGPILVPEISLDQANRVVSDDDGGHRAFMQQIGVESCIVVPLIAGGQIMGVLSLAMAGSGRRFTQADLATAEELAQRAAQALDNARLYCEVEAAIRNREQALALLNTLVATAPIGFAFIDTDMRYQLINERLALINGHPSASHLGKTVREVMPNMASKVEPILQQVITTGEALINMSVSAPIRGSRALQHWLVSYYPVCDSEKRTLGVGILVVEITEVREMETALTQHKAQLAGIINSAMDAIVTIDSRQEIILFNKAAEDIFGYTADTIIGQPLLRLIPEQYRSGHGEHVVAFGHAGATNRTIAAPGMLVGCRADGSEFPIEASISHIEVDGQKLYTVILRDISERKRLEAQLLQAQKMESIGRLAGGVAHDFNNLLMGMMGYANLALRSVAPDSELHDDLMEICKAADRAAMLTRQLLAFARKQVIEPRVLNLNDLLLDIDKFVRRLIGTDIELVILPAQRLRPVKVDPGQFQQILMNLAVNARDAMPNGGKLTIETTDVLVREEDAKQLVGLLPGPYVCLTVRDTGRGMDEATRTHAFEPFFTTKSPGKGTGLGLATCYGIVKQHGGYINVESTIGEGTTFTIYLPHAAKTPTGPLSLDEPEVLPQGKETVLLVEDEPAVRSYTLRVLRQQGYRVLEATNGVEALQLLHAHPDNTIQLLLTDVVMPQMGGAVLAEQLKAQYPHVKVLFMSGYTDNSIGQWGELDERTSFIQKPFLPAALARKLREVLD